MDKKQFMDELKIALSALPDVEREAALKYYDEYFEDAGAENAQQVSAELGSPRELAQRMLDDYKEIDIYNKKESGEREGPRQKAYGYWHKNYKGYGPGSYGFPKEEKRAGGGPTATGSSYKYHEKSQHSEADERNRLVKIILLIVFALPLLGVVTGVLGGIVGVFAGIIGVIVGYIGACVGLSASGVVYIAKGVAMMFYSPFTGILYIGLGMVVVGLGGLMVMLGIMLAKKVIPWAINLVKRLYQKIFKKRGQAV